jgi:hypothetical protein
MATRRKTPLADLRHRRAEAAAEADRLASQLDQHPTPVPKVRAELDEVAAEVNRLDAEIARNAHRRAR